MRRVSLLLALLILVVGAGRASAQVGDLPVAPDPSECTAEPLTVEDVLERVMPTMATPGAVSPEAMAATPETFALPQGNPADPETVAEITALMREVLACINTGNFLTVFAYATDDFLLQILAEEEGSDGDDGDVPSGTPPPVPAESYATLVAVHDVTVLPDGRVGALVETIFPDEEPGVQVDYFSFVEEDGRWLIDGIVEDLEGQYSPTEMATPAG